MAHGQRGYLRFAIVPVAAFAAIFLQGTFAPVRAQTYKVLYTLKGNVDGSWPTGGLARDASGNLYGVTTSGGGSPNCSGGCGTIFRLDRHGHETVLYSFTGEADGQYPMPVLLDGAGNIYGTALWGGQFSCNNGYGPCGTVFKLDNTGTLTVLHAFTGVDNGDGANPEARLIMDSDGNLYGTTLTGGQGCTNQFPPGCGVVFKVDPNGVESVLHMFNGADGADPSAGLLLDPSGELYGTTTEGGAHNYGVVFKLKKNGKEIVLHDFTGRAPDGGVPFDDLVSDDAGNLYGTTEYHPAGSNIFGTVFRISKKGGAMTVLHAFDLLDGGYPVAGLVRDSDGNLYGTALSGGNCPANECGVVFKLDKNGAETVLYNFQEGDDGWAPRGVLVRDRAGRLYGAALGGRRDAGVVFKITP